MQDTYEIISNNKWKIILSFALAGFFVFIIIFLIGFNDVVNTLKQANGVLILLNFVLEAGIILVWTLRWKMILDVVDESPKFSTLLMMLFASLFGNNITPSAAGGEPLRAYLLREVEGTPFELGFASSTADRVFEFLPFVLISIIAALLVLSWNIPVITRIIVIAMVFVSIFLFAVVIYAGLKKEIAQRIIISIARSIYPTFIRFSKKDLTFVEITEKLIFYVNRFSRGFIIALRNRKVFVIGFILSFVMWGLDMLRMYVCFSAVGVHPPVVALIVIYTIGILISLLPLLPGAWGIREATLIGLFAVVGISADVVLSASLIDRIASYIAPTIIGGLAALHYGRKVKNRGIKAQIIEPDGT
jgi:glycosyltransferase 2 family protein